eukprot:gene31819-39304_t
MFTLFRSCVGGCDGFVKRGALRDHLQVYHDAVQTKTTQQDREGTKQTYDRAFDTADTYAVSHQGTDPCQAHHRVFNLIDGVWMAHPADCLHPFSKLFCEHDKALDPVEFRSIPEGLRPNVFDAPSLLVTSHEIKRDDGCPTAELITFDPDKAYREHNRDFKEGDEDDSPYATTPGITLKWDVEQGKWRYDPEVCMECLEHLKSKAEQSFTHTRTRTGQNSSAIESNNGDRRAATGPEMRFQHTPVGIPPPLGGINPFTSVGHGPPPPLVPRPIIARAQSGGLPVNNPNNRRNGGPNSRDGLPPPPPPIIIPRSLS